MKTTIDLPEDLLHRAKIAAAQRKTTLKELIFQGLEHVIEHPGGDLSSRRKASMKRLLQKMRAHNTQPMRPLKREDIYER